MLTYIIRITTAPPSVPPRMGCTLGTTPTFFIALDGSVDDVHYGFDLLTHVEVLVFDFDRDAVGEFVVDFACKVFELFFAAFEAVAVVVADDVGEHGFFYGTFNRDQVVEAFVAFGVFGSLPAGSMMANWLATRMELSILCLA